MSWSITACNASYPYAASSTLLNVETLEVVRHGSCFADIAYILQRHFGETLAQKAPS